MKQIAIYGKGGIGKSTITANLSAALSRKGHKVLQIGCDPKHDSTKLLLGGISQNTVLELLKTKSSYELKEEEVVIRGYNGIECIEAGGPEPGVGCAGRGILAMARTLEDIGLNLNKYDIVIYDVLGDVVCGGFAVPMRDEYADEVYIVTSGEIMALYAANNISKGLLRFGGKLAGIILNERNVPFEKELVNNFAEKIGTEILADFPRDNRFREAEIHQVPVLEKFPESEISLTFENLAQKIISNNTVKAPKPLTDDEFEKLICTTTGITKLNTRIKPATLEKSDSGKKFHCCSLAGAYAVTANIENTVTIMHSPANCANIALNVRYLSSFASPAIPNLLCTNLDENDLIYGAEKKLEQEIQNALEKYSPEAVFIITSCPTGIIGDDPEKAAEKFKNSPVPVIPIGTDGILKGGYTQGVVNAYKKIAETVIKKDITPQKYLINIIGEEIIGIRAEENFAELKSALAEMGFTVNCRFIRSTSLESIRNFNKAEFSYTVNKGSLALAAQKILKEVTGTRFIDISLPMGFSAPKPKPVLTEPKKETYKSFYTYPDSLTGAIAAIESINGGVALLNSPPGCRYTASFVIEKQDTVNTSEDRVPCTSLDETDFIHGSAEKLKKLLKQIEQQGFKLAGIVNGPGTALIGDDLEGIVKSSEVKVPVINIEASSFTGQASEGHNQVWQKILNMQTDSSASPQNDLVITGSTLLSLRCLDNIEQIKDELVIAGIKKVINIGPGAGLEELGKIKNSKAVISMNEAYGNKLAELISEKHGIKNLFPGLLAPIGLQASEKWLSCIVTELNGDLEALNNYIASSKAKLDSVLSRFRSVNAMPEDLTCFISADSAIAAPLMLYLQDYLGIKPLAVSLLERAENSEKFIQENFDTQVLTNLNPLEEAELLQKLQPDIILGSSNDYSIAYKTFGTKVPFVAISYPEAGRIFLTKRPLMGIAGTLVLTENILNEINSLSRTGTALL